MFDSDTLTLLMDKFLVGVLFFIRILGMMSAAPFFKNSAIIPQVKVFLAIIIATSVTTAFWQEQPQIDFHLWYIALLVIKEFLVGVAVGFSATLVFHAARFAGGIVDFDMGYHTAILFNQDETSPTLVGEFKSLITLMMFIIIGGHLFMVEAIYASARAVPLTYFEVTESTTRLLITFATSVLIVGVKMAAPILVALFLTNLSLALLARVAPQTNIFILSFQLKVVVGLLVLIGTVPLLVYVSKYFLQAFQDETMKILLSLNPARV